MGPCRLGNLKILKYGLVHETRPHTTNGQKRAVAAFATLLKEGGGAVPADAKLLSKSLCNCSRPEGCGVRLGSEVLTSSTRRVLTKTGGPSVKFCDPVADFALRAQGFEDVGRGI